MSDDDPKLEVLKTEADLDHAFIVERLEKWLADRKADGGLVAFAAVVVNADRSIGTIFVTNGERFALQGAIVELQHRVTVEHDE